MIPIVGTRIAVDFPKSYLVFPLLVVMALCALYEGGANNEYLRVHYWCPDSVMRNLVFIDRTCQVRQH